MSSFQRDRAQRLRISLQAAGQGDRAAFGALYQDAAPGLFGVCVRILRDRERAREACQEAMLRIWQKAHLFDPDKGDPMAWMVAVTRRCVFSRIESEHAPPVEPLDDRALAISDPGSADAEAVSDIRRCIGLLPDNLRTCVMMICLHGLSYDESAAQLSVPVGTVKTWMHRATRQLEQCLRP